ncbi:DUF6648 family protein [Anoxynatronum buryatiense]|uniref:Uncharacterized protein n=1 Tax=Anoxynatronum buryatiense TaxID=489973 RepID=A0AA46AI47_9CLOT|nr:DUF6648 family protein [Anoxynatronum buryatiense]SMP46439.1 hypothetical protein SAMN06296020_10311 [Anoxynatronum buryatiense]
MRYVAGRNLFKEYADIRESLIFQYKKGDLSKKEYIRESYDLLLRYEASPFQNVDSFDKAVFNYHYYNTMAKYIKMKADELRQKEKHQDLYRQMIQRKDRYYHQKDRTSWCAVKLLDFSGIEAYHIKVTSRFLKESLLEIIFFDHPEVVFHSRGKWLKEQLEKEGLFLDGTRRSVIEHYVNERY